MSREVTGGGPQTHETMVLRQGEGGGNDPALSLTPIHFPSLESTQ